MEAGKICTPDCLQGMIFTILFFGDLHYGGWVSSVIL